MRSARDAPIAGPARFDARTKRLVQRLRPGDIALIAHRDLDGASAEALVAAGARAVVNLEPFLSGRFPARGAALLLRHGVPAFEALDGHGVLASWPEGERLGIHPRHGWAYACGRPVARLLPFTRARLAGEVGCAERVLDRALGPFLANTLTRALAEAGTVLRPPALPRLREPAQGRPAVVVCRGMGALADLLALRPFIAERRPLIIGVDGGADVVLRAGLKPHVIVGDMDSASDRALACGAQLVVHAYPDGRAPGLARVSGLGLPAQTFAVPGTSEDAALLLAFWAGADPIVAVGTHSGLLDFLERGRPGMASTLLVRLLVAPRLVDARGLARLYPAPSLRRQLGSVMAAAAAAAAALVAVSPPAQGLLRALWLELRVTLGTLGM